MHVPGRRAIAHQPSLGDDGGTRGDGGQEIPGLLVVWTSPGRNPSRVSVGAAPAVYLLRAVGQPGLLLEEVESPSLLDPTVIVDGEPHGVPEAQRPWKQDGESVARALEAERRPARDGDGADLELPIHVEPDGVQARTQRRQRGDHPTIEAGRI